MATKFKHKSRKCSGANRLFSRNLGVPVTRAVGSKPAEPPKPAERLPDAIFGTTDAGSWSGNRTVAAAATNTKSNSMLFREAKTADIKQIQVVRNAVKENRLSDPSRVTDSDCEEFIRIRGKGWVCEVQGRIVGFAIADLRENNIWALFVHPEFEGMGIGKQLHDTMLDWYFSQTKTAVWLGTMPNTRAETFYRKRGWTEVGSHGNGEIKFLMTYERWVK